MPASTLCRGQSAAGDFSLRRLLIRPGAIGDCIVSLPALEYLRAEYTEVWVPAANAPLIRFADRVRSIASTGIDAYPPRVAALTGFDSIVSWYGSNRPEFVEACRGLPVKFHRALPEGELTHAVDFYLDQAGAQRGAVPRISVPRSDGGFIAAHPFSGSLRKNWPLENFLALAKLAPLPIRFTAGPDEALDGAVRFDDLFELAKWLASARAYIGNDSGISHLAAAVGTPVVALFGTDPRVWAPRGSIVKVLRMPVEPAAAADILASICS